MQDNGFHSNFVSGVKIDETFGKYRMTCKVGVYCKFGIEQFSNQVHAHDCFELCVVTSGSGRFIHNNIDYIVNACDVIIADAGILHEVQANGNQDMHLLYIFIDITADNARTTAKTSEDLLIDAFIKNHNNVVRSKPYIISYLQFIESYGRNKGNRSIGTYQAVKGLIQESLIALTSAAASLNHRVETQNPIDKALDYIDANLYKRIYIKDIVEVTHISQRTLEYLFKKNLEKTVTEYINEKKIDLSCHYLAMHFSITDTGRLVGIPDLMQFSRMFKKYKHISPKKYQERKFPENKGMGRRID